MSAEARQRALFVASSGGHVSELLHLQPHFSAADDSLWVTFDTPQTRSLLQGRRVEFIPYVRPRDPAGVLRSVPRFARILASGRGSARGSRTPARHSPASAVADHAYRPVQR